MNPKWKTIKGVGSLCGFLWLTSILAGVSTAATIEVNLGVFSFDVLNPASAQSPGVNQFTIYNFTGVDNLAPDFPVATDITFQSPSVDVGTGPTEIDNINPNAGGVEPSLLTFLSSDNFSSATFSATLSTTDVELADGTSVKLAGDQISAVILPSQGKDLTAGTDFALLAVSGSIVESNTPEPTPLNFELLALAVLTSIGVVRTNRKRQRALLSDLRTPNEAQ